MNKKKIIFTLTIILVLIILTFVFIKVFTKDYNNISKKLYIEVLNKYTKRIDENTNINKNSFINIKTYEILSDEIIEEIINEIDNININNEKANINIEIKFTSYKLNSLRLSILIYRNNDLYEVIEYMGDYKNGKWNIKEGYIQHINKSY